MTYKYATFIKVINVLTDFLLLNFAFFIGLCIHEPDNANFGLDSHHQLNFLLLNLFWFYCTSIEGLYADVLKREAEATIKATITALAIFIVLTIALVFTFKQLALSYELITAFLIIFTLLMLISKTSFLLVRKSRRRFWIEFKKIVVVGAGPVGIDLYNYINANPQLGYRIEGVFDDDFASTTNDDRILLGKVDDCFYYVKSHGISEVYCALPNIEVSRIKSLMHEADKQMIRMRLVPDVSSIFDKNVMLEVYGHMPILTARQEPLEDVANEIVKRAFDIVFSLLAIIFILSWLTPILALVIKLESKGPVFFRQLRSGKDNKPFYCLKFRSMTVNNDSDYQQASKGDTRITKVGSFLRRSSMDELPQFINVLLGNMSVVGPRPHMLKHTHDYSMLIDNYMVRQFLTPGMTGWAQVNGFRGETKETASMSKRVNADIWYLENWSLFLDLKIVFLTVWQAIGGNQKAF